MQIHQPDFVQMLNLTALIPFLQARLLLTDSELDVLLSNGIESDRTAKITRLLQYIQNKSSDSCKLFLQALESEDTHLGHIDLCKLMKKCTPECKFYLTVICLNLVCMVQI